MPGCRLDVCIFVHVFFRSDVHVTPNETACKYGALVTTGVMEVIVLDKPSPPEGPLEYDDVTSSTVTLSWNPPKDDGGSPIT